MVKIPLNKVLENCMGMGMTGILQIPQKSCGDRCMCCSPAGRKMLWHACGTDTNVVGLTRGCKVMQK